MRIKNVKIENFRGIRRAMLENLEDLVVIAGQNGSGKSCLLDGMRFIKSIYGGYQPNEYHQWFGEFQINFNNDPRALASLFNDPLRNVVLEVEIELHADERKYLEDNGERLITQQAWRAVVPELLGWRNLDAAPLTTQYRMRESEVKKVAKDDMKLFQREIAQSSFKASIWIEPASGLKFYPSKVLELAFSQYEPNHIGVIDYHGAHRQFSREQLSTINVNLDAIEEQKRQSALYNYNNKYANVKSEMAGLYVREALAARAKGVVGDAGVLPGSGGEEALTQTLKELFSTFFPEKEFLGPQPTPNGGLRFPVKVGGRETHDLDELSSGEKEILYGYLRLKSSAPKNSVVLLDEPELHLNPRLTRNLPQFYYQHLAKKVGNQIWLITHSDAILRESVGRLGASVYHMLPSAYLEQNQNQAQPVKASDDLERAVIDLVGDLAAYNPGGKIVIFEGEDSDFDIFMVSALFPQVPIKANLISGTNKTRVRGLHALLDRLREKGRLPSTRIYSVTDKDSEDEVTTLENQKTWDRYHIENYLLEPTYIDRALDELLGRKRRLPKEDISKELLACARKTVSDLIIHRVCLSANKQLVTAIRTNINRGSSAISEDLYKAIEASCNSVLALKDTDLSKPKLSIQTQQIKDEYEDCFKNGDWVKVVKGRDVLNEFIGKHGRGVKYETFRNIIIARMRDDKFEPAGMKKILASIVN